MITEPGGRNQILGIVLALLFAFWPRDIDAGSPTEINNLKVGQRISVNGRYSPNGFFVGRKVMLMDRAERTVLESKISKLSPGFEILNLMGINVVLNGDTDIFDVQAQRISFRALSLGRWVRVEGKHIGKRVLLASKVAFIEPPLQEAETIESRIQRISLVDPPACLMLDMPIIFFEESVTVTDFRKEREGMRSIKRDDDDQQPAPITIGNFLVLGGKAEIELAPQKNLDLDGGEDEMASQVAFKPELAINVSPDVEGYARLKLKRKPLIHAGSDHRNASIQFEATQMYLTYDNIFNTSWRLQFGRQRFKDKREWWFDENLDAIRLILDSKRLDVKLGLVSGAFFPQDDQKDVLNQPHYYVSTRVKLGRRTYVTGLLFGRKHRHQNIALNWFGLQARGQLLAMIQYWSNLAAVLGTDVQKTVRGWGFDIGMRIGTHSIKPVSMTLAYAYGSGDRDPDDNQELNFRQTGLQENSAKLGGLKRIKYYGELFAPELSNMHIWTVGLGLRPTLRSSLELLFHAYRQVVAQDFLQGSNLDAVPLGLAKDLGKELDFVFIFREISNLDVTLNLGYFRSGLAFGEKPANVFLGKLRMQVFY